jgi:nitric oxide reductase activation protein
VQVYTPDRNRTFGERVDQKKAVNRWMDGLKKKGTDRDRLILDLYTSVTVQPGPSERIERELLLEEFPQFRSKVEPMSDDEIRKEIRKEEEEKRRKIEESSKTNRPLTLNPPKEIPYEPPWHLGSF